MSDAQLAVEQAFSSIKQAAEAADGSAVWPAQVLEKLSRCGCGKLAIPRELGGTGPAYAAQLDVYRRVARASLATALIITQRDGAVDLIARSGNRFAESLLPDFAAGRLFTSVGISQLTTSLSASGPKMRAAADGAGFRLDGVMPWVTGARHCDWIVTGGVLPDGQHLLALAPRTAPQVRVDTSFALMALTGTETAAVHLDGLRVPPEWVLRGPADAVLSGRSPVKGLTVTAVAVGVCDGLVQRIRAHRSGGEPGFAEALAVLFEEHEAVCTEFEAAQRDLESGTGGASAALRPRLNVLAAQLATAHLNLCKGGGYVAGHVAERLVREAMFFQVWSSPLDTQVATLHGLTGGQPHADAERVAT